MALVPERLKVRHELDVSLATVFVERQDVLSGERVSPRADRGMARKIKSVFDVQLQLVVLVGGKSIDQGEQRFQRRHFAARYVEHQTAMGEDRSIANRQRGQAPAFCAQQLS